MINSRTKGKYDLHNIESYEDYLDSLITSKDMYFLEDQNIAREIYENGFSKGKKDILTRKQFEEFKSKKKHPGVSLTRQSKKREKICSLGKDLTDYPLLNALGKREKLVRDGKLSVIIYIRDIVNGCEVSGYIDYLDRLKNEDFEKYFLKRDKLVPKISDLSFYNWKSKMLKFSDSYSFSIITSGSVLVFKHKRDRKTIEINPIKKSSKRKPIKTDEYLQCCLYEHNPRFGTHN